VSTEAMYVNLTCIVSLFHRAYPSLHPLPPKKEKLFQW